MVSLVALLINVLLLSILPTEVIWPLFLILTCGHLWANYKAKRCILFSVFNHRRFHLVCFAYLQSSGQQIPSIEQVNHQEPILFLPSLPYRARLGVSLSELPDSIFPSADRLEAFHRNEHDRFFLLYERTTNTFYALLKPNADHDDLLRLNFSMELLSFAMNSTGGDDHRTTTTNTGIDRVVERICKQLPDLDQCLTIVSEHDNSCYEAFKMLCTQHGFHFHRCLFNVDAFRIQ